ncbi:MAG: hypothetical protein ACYTGO_02610, partial [Planctomycetota bacterium]
MTSCQLRFQALALDGPERDHRAAGDVAHVLAVPPHLRTLPCHPAPGNGDGLDPARQGLDLRIVAGEDLLQRSVLTSQWRQPDGLALQ